MQVPPLQVAFVETLDDQQQITLKMFINHSFLLKVYQNLHILGIL